jgi:hypothetical protein
MDGKRVPEQSPQQSRNKFGEREDGRKDGDGSGFNMFGSLAIEESKKGNCIEFFKKFGEDSDEVDQVDFLDTHS